ncbi:MAG: ABC transporter permease [Oscillospiraceae bacterium]|jgi:ribose transport system permease protein|nr:ABC transporter permease [Oscillospiraceae bacterium]
MKKAALLLKKSSTYLIFLLLVLVCIILSPDFFTPVNIMNIGRQYAGTIIVSMGMLFVILTGGIDLSVGSIVAVGSVVISLCLDSGLGMLAAVIFTLAVGFACGLVTGVLVAYTKMAPFIASVAMMTMARGAAFVISNGSPIQTPKDTIGLLGRGSVGVVPTLVVIAAIVVAVFWFVQNYTTFGRLVIAIGSNESAVDLAGIRVKLYKVGVYAISGVCCAVGGILICSRTATGSPVIGTGLELDGIASCVIGGASLAGGEGAVLKTVIGVLILALIGNVMNLLSVPSYPQDIIKGAIIVAAVLMQKLSS